MKESTISQLLIANNIEVRQSELIKVSDQSITIVGIRTLGCDWNVLPVEPEQQPGLELDPKPVARFDIEDLTGMMNQ